MTSSKSLPWTLTLRLPSWVKEDLSLPDALATPEERMRLVCRLAEENVRRETGGPFGAAVFESASGRLVSAAVNVVVASRCSLGHAEMLALALAQRRRRSYDLGAAGQPSHQLVTSAEPCAMCLGAIPWSGVRSLVYGAREEMVREIGFDEGVKATGWEAHLRRRGIHVECLLADEGQKPLLLYRRQNGRLYNSRVAGEAAND